MRRVMISLALGLSFGFFALATTFALISFTHPGWLRAVFSPARATALAGVTPTPGAPGSGVGGGQPTGPTPTGGSPPLPTVPGACGGPERMTIALLGVDDRGEGYARATRTDAISLVNVRFPSPSAALFSIPRDLYVALPNLESAGITQDRINTAYLHGETYGVAGGGPAELKETIELNFGIRVDRYVLVNFGAFEAVVDAVGGIEVDVPKAIYDPEFPADQGTGTIVFELAPGLQHMDGETALRYVRTRHQDDDYRRVQRQQEVLLALRDKLLSPSVIPQIPALLGQLGNLARTDLSPQEIAALACIGPQIDRSDIIALAIDGTMVIPWTTPTGGRVSIPNREMIAPLVREFLGEGN